jgi:hypothetical protein
VPILIVLPAVPVPIFIILALLLVPTLTVPVVPESKVIAPAPLELRVKVVLLPPDATVRPEAAVKIVEVPRETVPEPPCKVKLPALVDQVAAAAEVNVNAPAVVDHVEAAPAVKVKALAPVEETVPALAKVKAVAEVNIVSIEDTPVKAPALTKNVVFSCQVEVPVLYLIVELLVVPVGIAAIVAH